MIDPHQTRLRDGPSLICRLCDAYCNHVSGLCHAHRSEGADLTPGDRAYLLLLERRKAVATRH